MAKLGPGDPIMSVDAQGGHVSLHNAAITWKRKGAEFVTDHDRSHEWVFDSGVVVPASSAPDFSGDPSRVDPEEAFVASISSCHMLWFLALAAKAGFVIDEYVDHAVGTMGRDDTGVTWITDVELRPAISWSSPAPDPAAIKDLHHRAHERCFIANSVRSAITISET